MPYVAAAHKERYSVLDRRMAGERKTLGLGFLKTLVMITLILWIALPIFCECGLLRKVESILTCAA